MRTRRAREQGVWEYEHEFVSFRDIYHYLLYFASGLEGNSSRYLMPKATEQLSLIFATTLAASHYLLTSFE
jgi:hypothetical protein